MSRRIITTENLEEDSKIENHLRPQLLQDYVGQEKVKDNVALAIAAAKMRGDALDHVLLYGPPVFLYPKTILNEFTAKRQQGLPFRRW